MSQTDNQLDTWALVELMGHRRVIARIRPATFPAGFLQVDEPELPGHPARSQIVNPAAVYAIHPMTEEAALAYAARWRSAPLTEWDLPDQLRDLVRERRAAIEAARDDEF